MFLNFQTQADIRNEIFISFSDLKRAATIPEIAAAIWFRSAVDGTRQGVADTVRQEMVRMAGEGLLELVDRRPDQTMTYYQPELLSRLAWIAD